MMRTRHRGITLIELVIYCALYACIVGGIMSALYTCISLRARTATDALLIEEGIFIEARVAAAIRAAHTVDVTADCSTLVCSYDDASTIVLTFDPHGVSINDGSGDHMLTSDRITIATFSCARIDHVSSDRTYSSINGSFELVATTSSGSRVSHQFFLYAPIEH